MYPEFAVNNPYARVSWRIIYQYLFKTIMKSNRLFEKRIELKNCQINGGRLAESSTVTSTATSGGGCTDTQYVTKNDCGEPISACTDYVCK
ncbi:hypothetical protein CA265_12325 [Sphingobacteriaceae bacterium GW460-11-11-14-LB5]|nr:hypothetical protein CA265_12325 [Sphingobacteriaceae bacterium GW460-11-11-14-LB5]